MSGHAKNTSNALVRCFVSLNKVLFSLSEKPPPQPWFHPESTCKFSSIQISVQSVHILSEYLLKTHYKADMGWGEEGHCPNGAFIVVQRERQS